MSHITIKTPSGELFVGKDNLGGRTQRGIWTRFAGQRVTLATCSDEEKLDALVAMLSHLSDDDVSLAVEFDNETLPFNNSENENDDDDDDDDDDDEDDPLLP
jgi:hypothetical protein